MSQSWWASALQWVLWGVIMAAVMGWVARSRQRSSPGVEARRLVHPPSTLIIGLICFAFFSCIAIVSNVYANETTTIQTTSVFLGFAMLSLVLIAEYLGARHEISDEGMVYGRLLRSRRSLAWSDVVQVRYATGMKWFRLETLSGEVARISIMLRGLPEFARTVLSHVPASAIDEETATILHATAGGNPPRVWG